MSAGNGAEIRSVNLLIAALGGEGGGVLTNWLVAAAMAEDLPVQSTSIPGVAQRTGATTYYLEIFPVASSPGGDYPVMSLYPGPGNVDVMVASELLEAGRAMELGFVSPERTTLIASTHRVYSIAEKSAMADGTFDGSRILSTAAELAQRPVLADLEAIARREGTVINAVLLGAVAGTGVLPIPEHRFEEAIRAGGIAVDANLRGFQAGLALVREQGGGADPAVVEIPADAPRISDLDGVAAGFPDAARDIVGEGLRRVADYQDEEYARTYAGRVQRIRAIDESVGGESRGWGLTREAGRYLALWMTYEDVIRVADLKSRPERFERVREETGAQPDEPVRITEFFKPGVEEICAILPSALATRVLGWAYRDGKRRRLHFPLRVKSHTITGYLMLRFLARLKSRRRRSYRFQTEQALIEEWLARVEAAARVDYGFGLEVIECANLNKGYGETFERGRGNYLKVMSEVVEPAIEASDAGAATAVREVRAAALADPEGDHLAQVLVAPPQLH